MIHRIDVRVSEPARGRSAGNDPVGTAIRHQIQELGKNVGAISTTRIFLIDADADANQMRRVAQELLADPVVEQADFVDPAHPPADDGRSRIEIHLKPGVMDPVAASTEMAIRDMGLTVREVRTGRAYLIQGTVPQEELNYIAGRVLANGVIESVHFDAFVPKQFETGRPYQFKLNHVPLRELSDEQLMKLSREGHLFLSLAEMKAIQTYFREQKREPTDIELETLAQTWSEHCVHKTLKSAVEVYDENGKLLRKYGNLIKETIFDSTMTLMDRGGTGGPAAGTSPMSSTASVTSMGGAEAKNHGRAARATSATSEDDGPFCLSVFQDNAGVIAFDETDAVCFKVETHNHPSAIEPYGGSATGVGGVIRDVLGTGLAAKPIANTDVFCVAYPDAANPIANRKSQIANLPKGIIHPKRILQQVVAGVRDYGNRMGIPTVNGAVYFDDNYVGNPLVFCGCVGLIPRDKIHKDARPGDAIVVMGGRTGRDGIHGATFSSAELTDTHADEFSHAVQIGNAITEKKVADVILQARDRGLFSAVTDCGAGGLSSAVGEMGEKIGAEVHLDRVPLKYQGLRYDEIWISEAQERMVLAVPQERVEELLALSRSEDVESTVIGTFGTDGSNLILNYDGTEVGRMAMRFVHKGIPMPTRKARVRGGTGGSAVSSAKHAQAAHATSLKDELLARLAHPNIASKHWIIRQYDHEVQGGSVVKPLIGPLQTGPSDASVIRPKLGSHKGVVLSCGLAPHIADPYEMALAAIDEAIRNAVCVGGDPEKMAILDNFCWPSVDDEITMGTLVRACEACRDGALAYGVPFISGKDSLHNQFTNQETKEVIRIPATLLISAIGIVQDVRRCLTMDFKGEATRVVLIEPSSTDLAALARLHRAMAGIVRDGLLLACHDVSDGGIAVAAAEMCIAAGRGMAIPEALMRFDEPRGCYLVELQEVVSIDEIEARLRGVAKVTAAGITQPEQMFTVTADGRTTADIPLRELAAAWRGTLDW
jgi:phosphoribosylformylglycinamidine synthase subunit PurSL